VDGDRRCDDLQRDGTTDAFPPLLVVIDAAARHDAFFDMVDAVVRGEEDTGVDGPRQRAWAPVFFDVATERLRCVMNKKRAASPMWVMRSS
jgi:hypothetical protein